MSTLRFARITLAIVVSGLAMGTVESSLGFDGGIANGFFIVAAMLLASLSDRELFWATPPKRHRR
jgi:hypothetical protein